MNKIEEYKPENPEKLLLLITPETALALNQEIGKGFRFFTSYLLSSESISKLEEAPAEEFKKNNDFSIACLNREQELIELPVSAYFRERILLYLQEGVSEKPFDCNGFIHFLNELPFKFCDFDFEAWEMERLAEGTSLEADECILIGLEICYICYSHGSAIMFI